MQTQVDLTLFAKKQFITFEELKELLHLERRKYGQDRHGGYDKFELLLSDFEGLVLDAVESGKLVCDSPNYPNMDYTKFKKAVVFFWLVNNDVLGWLEGRQARIPKIVIEFIQTWAQKSPETQKQTPSTNIVTGKDKTRNPQTKKHSERHAQSSAHRTAARKVAKKLWKENPSMTIADMINHDEINCVAPDYADRTLRDWLKDLAPSNKPGRPAKNN